MSDKPLKIRDWSRLRENFKDAIGKLPDYKRREAWEYVNQLNERIEELNTELHKLEYWMKQRP